MAANKTLAEQIADADEVGNQLLAKANEAAERGDKASAEALYEKGQRWLDISNKLRGDA